MKDWIAQHQVTEVECIVPDLAGAARGKIMPAAKFTGAADLRMPQSIFMQSVTGDYPEIYERINPLDVDMLLKPDPNTIRMLPWAREPSAQVIHDCFDMEGEPIAFSPRYVLRRVLDRVFEHYDARLGRPSAHINQYFRLIKKLDLFPLKIELEI